MPQDTPGPVTGGKTILEIGRGECRWPLGRLMAPADADTRFCARPVTGFHEGEPSPWCAHHAAKAYSGVPLRKLSAHEPSVRKHRPDHGVTRGLDREVA